MSDFNKLPFQSKKFIALFAGCCITSMFTLTALVVMICVPIVSSAVVNLITVALASINSAIGVYALGQSAVDWKVYGKSESIQKNQIVKNDERTTKVYYDDENSYK